MEILKRNSLKEGGFAGLKEHQIIKDPKLFGENGNSNGSWAGLGNFVYLADARFMPYGETHMHSHHEIDVITVMVKGNIAHEGSMEHGRNLSENDVQIQRAGGEGFSHNEINPDKKWNRLLQLWVLPEVTGQPASYKVCKIGVDKVTRIYGGEQNNKNNFSSKTIIDIATLKNQQQLEINSPFLAYVSRGAGLINDILVEEGDLIRGNKIDFKANEDVQLIVIYQG